MTFCADVGVQFVWAPRMGAFLVVCLSNHPVVPKEKHGHVPWPSSHFLWDWQGLSCVHLLGIETTSDGLCHSLGTAIVMVLYEHGIMGSASKVSYLLG